MSELEFWDYRKDLRNVFISPEMRCRFMRIDANTVTASHTHDLGHEVFMVMEGEIEFDVAGRKAVLGPGQFCVARIDEPHTLRPLNGQPATIYLSVTPHVSPTHTHWDEQGNKLPPRYRTVVDGWQDTPPEPDLLDAHLTAVRQLASAAAASAAVHDAAIAALRHALAAEDGPAARAAVDAMWEQILPTLQAASAMAEVWNQLAPRSTRP